MESLTSLACWFTGCWVCLLPMATALADQPPNIVLIMADDLGWGDTGFNGNQSIRTPHLDRLANRGVVFEKFYSAAPVCSPTRGSCLTGRHPLRYGIPGANRGHLPTGEWTIAEYLKEAGYRTGHFGKWHLGTLTKTVKESNRGGPRGVKHFSPPQMHGFDVCFSTEAKVPTFDPMWRPKVAASDRSSGNTWWFPIVDRASATRFGTHYWDHEGKMVEDNLDGDDSRIIVDRAVEFIEQTDDAPIFAVVWLHSPHLPVVAAKEYTRLYPDVSAYHQNYFGCITAMDAQLGRLIETITKTGKTENTMVAFCSDNGPEGNPSAPGSAGKLRGRKRSLYEGGVRVPAIISWPGHYEPRRVNFPAVTSDYLPTILDIVGLEKKDDRPLDGVSLVKTLNGKIEPRQSPIHFKHGGQRATIDGPWKTYSKKDEPVELYNLIEDPDETVNLNLKFPARVESMDQSFHAWWESVSESSSGNDNNPER